MSNLTITENGALAYNTTFSKVYDFFAFGGAYRGRSDEDKLKLFWEAFDENETLALKCLFYLRDVRGGQGERELFRVLFHSLCINEPYVAKKLLPFIPDFGRWDDLIYSTYGTALWYDTVDIISAQLYLDLESTTPSLLAKWMPSENASSLQTREVANVLRKSLHFTHKEYRKMLSKLRKIINVVERLMSENRWDEIEFDKIPSKAGLIYKNAFARKNIIAKKYEAFAKSEDTTVNARALYPYEIVRMALACDKTSATDRAMLEKYWVNQPDYLNGSIASMMCVVDTSGSMRWGEGSVMPIDVAISLGIYCAERCNGPFANHYISFASRPQLIPIEGTDFVSKVMKIYRTNLIDDTNLEAVFDVLLDVAETTDIENVPETLVIISDMEINMAVGDWGYKEEDVFTDMERIRAKWKMKGYKCPRLVYWNVNASNNTVLDKGEGVSFVSGCSPVIFEQILKGATGYELMLDKLNSDRYAMIR